MRHLKRLWKGSSGGFGGVLLLGPNWADWPATKRSYELMARFVHPPRPILPVPYRIM